MRNLSPETVLTIMAETYKDLLGLDTATESWGADFMKKQQKMSNLIVKLESMISKVIHIYLNSVCL